ncbi:DUF2946 family protein [Metapseudomonas resinovorans]|uniref:DUF2946 family protein n=1 Tax=Metapseudomonas resinovorans TaxID=53412 RepID=UPI00048D77B7|nr:DUF2946 domain-containing protein [Pseudomonas resinovorans]MDE3736724.1 DUF2946 domain-containing protein [Pseudomonas resinovorans]
MKIARQDRSLIAWMLYACVLFNLFACGLHHGQAMGLELSGLGGAFCSTVSDAGPTLDGDLSGSASSGWTGAFKCPVCGTVTLGIAALFVLAWLLRPSRVPQPTPEHPGNTHPRFNWPPANPRAP